jgi:aryl-alcohol dehydrogenase-like predicted oxidoreductase
MNYRKLGRSDLEVSEISFGCWTLGGLNWVNGQPNGWANVDEDEVAEAVRAGLDAGVNHFDNADVYGNGRAEQMLARTLDRLGVKTRDVIIATKVGHFPGTAANAYEPAHIRHQCEQSLINLGRDVIDLYYFHHGNFGPEDRYLAGAVDMAGRLVKEGKVRHIGLSAYSEDDFERLAPVVKPVCLQSSSSALGDKYIAPGSRVQKLMDAHGLSFVAFGPLAKGRLLAKYDAENPPKFDEGDHRRNNPAFKPEAIRALNERLEAIKTRFGGTPEDLARVALGYVLAHPNVACVIPGFRNAKQARCNVSPATKPALSADDVAFIRKTLAGL